jgi:hypothetical protein
VQSGEVPKGTRHVTVITSAGSGLGAVKKVSEWLDTLTRGPLKQEWYELVPAASPKKMSDEAKEKLAAHSAAKRAERLIRE